MQNDVGEFDRILSIIEGDDVIKEQLIIASVFLLIFEQLKKYTINQAKLFFSNPTFKNGKFLFKVDNEFKDMVKISEEERKSKKGAHKNDTFRASFKWFSDFGFIDTDEEKQIERLYDLRNEIGHDLFKIFTENSNELIISDVLFLFSIYVRMERWWIREIEAGILPEDYEGIEVDSIESIEIKLLRKIIEKAFAGMSDWEQLKSEIYSQ